MKKVIYSLLILFMAGYAEISAQNYEVIYSMKMNPEKVIKMMSHETGMPKFMLSFLKDDLKKAKLLVSVKMSKDKSDMQFLRKQSKFEIGVMGVKMDATQMFDNDVTNSYCDFANDIYYAKFYIDGQNYILRTKGEPEPKYRPVNLYKKILGHDCKKMIDEKNETTIWYAEDIPFVTQMYPGVPGLVLEISEEDEGITMTAASFEKISADIKLPEKAKEVTKKELKKIIESKEK